MPNQPSDFTLNILGCGSAVPTSFHNPSCQVVERRGSLMMIDCGEGAQVMMRRMKLKFNRLRHIFISHLHGDHVFGLPGLLSTLALNDTGGKLTVHIFERGADVLSRLIRVFCHELPYTLEWNILEPHGGQTLVESGGMRVTTFPLYHREPCVGFRFDEAPKPRHLLRDMLDFYNVPVARRQALREGADFVTPEGLVIPNSRLTTAPDHSASYAYCSDTMADDRVADSVAGVDLLYHESTYGDELSRDAIARGHSTARGAATVAARAGAGTLLLGHYSKRYRDVDSLVAEAQEVFPRVIASTEGQVIDIATGTVLTVLR